MFARFFGLKSLLVMLVFFCVWIWLSWSLQESFRLLSAEEVVTDFFLLPVLICVALWLFTKLGARLIKSISQAAPDVSHVKSDEQIAEPISYLEIYHAEFRLPVGDAPDAIVAALVHRNLPGLHHALKTADGLPVRAAWIQNLMTADFAEIGSSTSSLDATVQRALLLALDALQSVALRHFERNDSKGDLQIHFLAPARWDVHTLEAAEHWLVEGFTSSMQPSVPFRVSVRPVPSAVDALKYLNRLSVQISNDADDRGHVLLVGDSFIGDMPITQWDKQGCLYANEQPDGLIPGEGACALLLGRATLTQSTFSWGRVSQVAISKCYAGADRASDSLSELLGEWDGMGDAVGTVLIDSTHRASEQAEVAEVQNKLFPGLHLIKDSLALTLACGEMAAVAPIAALALAAHLSVRSQKNCLALSVQDDGWRAATLVLSPSAEARPAHEEPV